ncbi:hypothetical protein GWK48_06720 [Metallosphaera tengchongensis]|uniref:Uncharacterized protein n=1 Tax=Metallosphaera tengchongensis TaxID=1532350 RepID=A0A6N0NV84_9CREN|nr:hypothetical protein [Metallosphaera tengchongensis]QKR00107.1 hypothetical protein GWK48_06720 [Metallosphaera tengchongensis]
MKEDIFLKIIDDPYFSVLVKEKHVGSGVSRSYFYSIVRELRKLKVLEENALAFKVIVPYKFDNNCIRIISDKLLFLSNQHIGFTMILDEKPACFDCRLMTECVYGLKIVSKELRIKRDSTLPHSSWIQMVAEIANRIRNNSSDAQIIINNN